MTLRFALLALIPFLSGCSVIGDDSRPIILPVLEVETPTVVNVDEPFEISITGLLTSGCVSFDRLGVEETPGRLELTLRGTHSTHGACPLEAFPFTLEYHHTPQEAGELIVAVVGSNDTIERYVTVQ
jgi:hypothetical protein